MNSRPEVSVIVPSYNKPEYLPECLRSIQAQTFQDWECIVVSDGSPRVEEIRAAVRAMGDNRFRLVEHEVNRGLGAARNTGIREARGEWLIWVDEDDAIVPECLAKLYELALRTGDDVVHPQYTNMMTGVTFDRNKVPSLQETLESQRLNPCGFLISRKAFERAGFFDEDTIIRLGREDAEWWIRAVAAGLRVHTIPEGMYLYRPGGGSPDETASLDSRATLFEAQIRRYIVKKHARLYHRFPEARRRFLGQGWRREASAHAACGARWRAVFCEWMAAAYLPTRKSFRRALRSTGVALVGDQLVIALARMLRRAHLLGGNPYAGEASETQTAFSHSGQPGDPARRRNV